MHHVDCPWLRPNSSCPSVQAYSRLSFTTLSPSAWTFRHLPTHHEPRDTSNSLNIINHSSSKGDHHWSLGCKKTKHKKVKSGFNYTFVRATKCKLKCNSGDKLELLIFLRLNQVVLLLFSWLWANISKCQICALGQWQWSSSGSTSSCMASQVGSICQTKKGPCDFLWNINSPILERPATLPHRVCIQCYRITVAVDFSSCL